MKAELSKKGRAGFSLVELCLALAIVVFCLSALTGLLMVGLLGNRTASSQTTANSILAGVISDLNATPMASPAGSAAETSPLYGIQLPANPVSTSPSATTLYINADGQVVASPQGDATYLLTVTFLTNGTTSPCRAATVADLKLSWPAGATSSSSMGSVETFAALDRN